MNGLTRPSFPPNFSTSSAQFNQQTNQTMLPPTQPYHPNSAPSLPPTNIYNIKANPTPPPATNLYNPLSVRYI